MNSRSPLSRFLLLGCVMALTGMARAQEVRTFPGLDVARSETVSENSNANRAPVALDVVLECLDLNGKIEEMVGQDILNDDAHQTLKLSLYVSLLEAEAE